MSVSEREYRLAMERGAGARRNGGRIGDCPYRGKTPRVLKLAEAWREGYMRVHNLRATPAT